MKEIIKRYYGTNIYVSNYGKAFKIEEGYIEEMETVRNGNKKAISTDGNKRINIDSLVWRTFVGETNGMNRLHIRHLDGDLDNNRLDNLNLPQVKTLHTEQITIENLNNKIAQLEKEIETLKKDKHVEA